VSNEFEKWIQESAPSVEVNETRKEIHLAVLRQRLRERENRYQTRQKRTRRASVAAVALVFVLIGGNVSELGSDGFEFVVSESEYMSTSKTVEVGFRKSKIAGNDDTPSEFLRDLVVEMGFSDGVPVSVESVGIQGSESWAIVFEYDVKGSKETGGRTVVVPCAIALRK